MSAKDNFTPDEWRALVRAPMMVSYGVAGAAPSGGFGHVQEMKAVADAIVDASEQASDGSLVRAVVDEIRANATDATVGEKETVSVTEIRGKALEACRMVASILESKASGEQGDNYKRWLLEVGQKVAQAAKEGGFLAFGGVRVSDSEAETLREIAAALGTTA